MRRSVRVLGLLLVMLPTLASAQAPRADEQAEISLETLFPRKSRFGKTATGLRWSFDDRYLAYRWNAYADKGLDLWIFDSKERTTRRLTSPETFLPYDRTLPEILERYKKEKEENERRKGLSREERMKLEEEDFQKEQARKEPLKEYEGVGEFAWAWKSHELLFTYKGDIFRWKLADEKPTRITRTQEAESGLRYTRDDAGFYFRRGSGLFRASFSSPEVRQLNPELPTGVQMGGYWLSPDEKRMLISASKTTGPAREVDYITYRDRFAQARKTQRAVADDPFKTESYLYIHDLADEPGENPKGDGKPWEIYKWPAGEELGLASVHEEPWAPDSRRVVYATWKRDKREIEVLIADAEARKVTQILKDTHNGEHTTPGMTRPFFTPDGAKVVALLERSGFRHPWLLDPVAGTVNPITRGNFEVYPEKITPDGKTLYALSPSRQPAWQDVYAVELATGEMKRISRRDGRYDRLEIGPGFTRVAMTFANWKSPVELYATAPDGKTEEYRITQSHAEDITNVYRIQPELFTYKNRHGHTIHGYLIKPAGWKQGEKRPLLIYVYGGPLGTGRQVLDGSFSPDGYVFGMYAALKLGYLVAVVDPRGTSGYGALFGNANWEAPGKAQVEDLVDGVKHIQETYGADPARIGIHGWSFGGFQTQMCLYTAPEVFTLGIAGAGPTQWQNYNQWYSGGVIGKSRIGQPDDLDKYSLTKVCANLKSPLMLLHGVEDTNVLFQDTVMVYRELLKAGKGPLVELVIDPTGGHGLGGDIRTRERFAIYDGFLRRRWGAYSPGAQQPEPAK